MTPQQLAEHLRKEAEKHGAALSYVSFSTDDGRQECHHVFRGVVLSLPTEPFIRCVEMTEV